MSTNERRPRLAVTMGDPAGVGPEVLVKALADPEIAGLAEWVIVCDEPILRAAAEAAAVELPASVRLLDLGHVKASQIVVGQLSAEAGGAALRYVTEATRLSLRGEADAMVTAPLNKEAVSLSGLQFAGHTDFIAALCDAPGTRVLLVGAKLRVVHVSTHLPLRRACEVDTSRIVHTIELGSDAIRLLGIERPRIAVCALNPHAGEHGLFGDEETRFIYPAVCAAQSRGMNCEGPLAGDTVFLKAVRGQYDLVVAMYHDQGHIPMKLLDFEGTVNVTLGLPFIRTSVDHGTAFDIAGKNQANPTSMKGALSLAARMALGRGPLPARS